MYYNRDYDVYSFGILTYYCFYLTLPDIDYSKEPIIKFPDVTIYDKAIPIFFKELILGCVK